MTHVSTSKAGDPVRFIYTQRELDHPKDNFAEVLTIWETAIGGKILDNVRSS